MADPEEEAELLEGPVSSHSLSDDTNIADSAHEQADHDGMSEELLRQALAEANGFASTIGYTVSSEEVEACETVHDHAYVNESICVGNSGSDTGISIKSEVELVSSADSVLANATEVMFTNDTEALLANGTAEDVNETFIVGVGSLPESHIISVPDNIIPGSVIVSQSSEEQFQQSVGCGVSDDMQLHQDQTHIVQQIDASYVQDTDTQILQSSSETQLLESDSFVQPHTIAVSAASGITLTPEVLQNVIQQIQAQQQSVVASERKQSLTSTSAPVNTVSFTLVSPRKSSSPPLGSSQNPIRIIQQGNKYTPMQQLTPDQLQQIMQVVQQQHVNKNTQENGGAVIFNPQTNTRIMYRVIYPSELHKTQNGSGHTTYQVLRPSTSSQEQQTGSTHLKRPYRRRKDAAISSSGQGEEEEDKDKSASDAPELSKEEKEERKKHRPRTRSGRVSKPPKHMVQDYKHIHVLDWDEDYDDSDGGYSDFKHSDEEGKNKQDPENEHAASPEFFQALGIGRPKNHKCQTCDKSYIGQAGLARHYRLNPDHCTNPESIASMSSLHNGCINGEDSKDASLVPDGSLSQMSEGTSDVVKTNCHTSSIENFSEDSNTQDSLNSTGATSPIVPRGRGRGGFRGRWAHLKQNAQSRRKNKLKELIKQCTDEELMEVVLPRLVSGVSLWEYLLMKSENGGTRPQIDVIYREFETLKQHVRQACAEYMQPLSQEELEDDALQCKMIKVSDKGLAVCLNLEPVTYRVKEIIPGDDSMLSSVYSRLSSVTHAQSLNITASPAAQLSSLKLENPELLASKRPAGHEADESSVKRAKTSNLVPSLGHIHIPSSTSISVSTTYTITTSLPLFMDSKVNFTRSDLPLSSLSSTSLSSSQLAQGHAQLSTVTSSLASASSSQSVNPTSKLNSSTSSSIRSPYIHISCPTTKQQAVSYTVAGPRKQSPVTSSRTNKTHPIPMVITHPAGATTPVQPYIISNSSGSLSGLQKVILAAPEGQALRTDTVPLVLAAPRVQQSSSAAVLLTTGSSSAAHEVIIRPQEDQDTSDLIQSNQPSASKSQKESPSVTVTMGQAPSLSTNSRSILGMIKPTEVKVSRQLFNDVTMPSPSSSALTNGRGGVRAGGNSLDLPCVLPQFHGETGMSLSSGYSLAGAGSSSQQTLVKPDINKSLVTPPSGQQFASSPNKSVMSSHMATVDDISVLAAMELSGDELGPLNTSTDSLHGSITHLTDSMMTDMAATSGVSNSPDESSSLVDIVTADTQTFQPLHNGPDELRLINGSCQSFMKTKDGSSIIIQSSSPSSLCSSSPLTLSETSDFVHMPSKSHKLVSRDCTDTGAVQAGSYHAATNGSLSRHSLKSDININPSILISDISSLPFTDQGPAQIINNSTGHLSGISPILSSEELQENEISILSEPASCTEAQELDQQSGDLAVGDSLVGEDEGQLLLTEGTSIYQAEDGSFIIQSANGNTYQLQGAQGLPLETVQALLSGTLDQFVGEQANTHIH